MAAAHKARFAPLMTLHGGYWVFLIALILSASDLVPFGLSDKAFLVAAVTVWMAIWWISEAVPIAATSLLPLLVFPLIDVSPMGAVGQAYMSPFIVLLMAGFMAALAIERWGLHRRLSLAILMLIGASPARLVLGLMLAATLSSMWISNTAATLMMLPIALAVVTRAREGTDPDDEEGQANVKRFALVLFLGLAYAASVGGIATPIGTPPNLIFLGAYEKAFPTEPAITFAEWMGFGLPVVALIVPAIWLYLVYGVGRLPASLPVGGREILAEEKKRLGKITVDELTVALVFGGMAVLWVTRKISLGEGEVAGWAPALGLDHATDGSVALLGVILLFAWPSRTQPGRRLLDWQTARQIPWDMVLLFGGGVALAGAFKASGLSEDIARAMQGFAVLPEVLLIGAIALSVTFLTEVTSNTATATILMPVLAAFAEGTGIEPTKIMIPAVMSCSCAFMLPVATAPNAIVFGSGHVSIREMARSGFAINLGAAVIITLMAVLFF